MQNRNITIPGLQPEQEVDPARLAQVPGAHFSQISLLVTLIR